MLIVYALIVTVLDTASDGLTGLEEMNARSVEIAPTTASAKRLLSPLKPIQVASRPGRPVLTKRAF